VKLSASKWILSRRKHATRRTTPSSAWDAHPFESFQPRARIVRESGQGKSFDVGLATLALIGSLQPGLRLSSGPAAGHGDEEHMERSNKILMLLGGAVGDAWLPMLAALRATDSLTS
jgi:hypothetical protein